MADRTSKLGTSESVLGASMALGTPLPAGGLFEVSATNTLSLGQSVVVGAPKNAAAANSLTLNQIIIVGTPKPVSAANSLTFAQSVLASGAKRVSAANALVLAQHIVKAGTIHLAATQPLSLGSLAHIPEVFEKAAIQPLTLSNIASVPVIFTPPIKKGQATLTLENFARSNVFSCEATNSLNAFEFDISDPYNLVVTQYTLENQAVVDELVPSTQVLVDCSNSLSLDNESDALKVFLRSAVNALVLDQAISEFVPGGACSLHEWIGNNVPVLVRRDTVVFTFPFVSPTTTLELRAPDLDNIDRLGFERISRETRGGTLIVFSDPNWPNHKSFVISFTPLSEAEGQALESFVQQSVGYEIGYLDHESRQWKALIMNPQEPVVRNRDDVLAMQLELEVELV